MRAVIPLAIILVMLPTAQAIRVEIFNSQLIDGSASWKEVQQAPFQAHSLYWENTGSVACHARLRLDVYQAGSRVAVAWSAEQGLLPGAGARLAAYAHLKPGNYTARPWVYYCYDLLQQPEFNLSVPEIESRNDTLRVVSAMVADGNIILGIRSTENVSNIRIIPTEYTLGWLVESAAIAAIAANNTATTSLPFRAAGSPEALVELALISGDGRHAALQTVQLRVSRQAGLPRELVVALAGVLLVAFLIFQLKKGRLEPSKRRASSSHIHPQTGVWPAYF